MCVDIERKGHNNISHTISTHSHSLLGSDTNPPTLMSARHMSMSSINGRFNLARKPVGSIGGHGEWSAHPLQTFGLMEVVRERERKKETIAEDMYTDLHVLWRHQVAACTRISPSCWPMIKGKDFTRTLPFSLHREYFRPVEEQRRQVTTNRFYYRRHTQSDVFVVRSSDEFKVGDRFFKTATLTFLFRNFEKKIFLLLCKMKMNIEIVKYGNEDSRDEIAKHFGGHLAQMPTKPLNDWWSRILMGEWSVEGILLSWGTHINLFPGKTQPYMLGAFEDELQPSCGLY